VRELAGRRQERVAFHRLVVGPNGDVYAVGAGYKVRARWRAERGRLLVWYSCEPGLSTSPRPGPNDELLILDPAAPRKP
jgi:hypothetical protein